MFLFPNALFILEITLKINFTELPQLTLWDISDIINFYLSNRDKNGKFLMSNLDLNKKKKKRMRMFYGKLHSTCN